MSQDSDDEDEHFEDLPDEDTSDDNEPKNHYKDSKSGHVSAITPSWVHKKNIQGSEEYH